MMKLLLAAAFGQRPFERSGAEQSAGVPYTVATRLLKRSLFFRSGPVEANGGRGTVTVGASRKRPSAKRWHRVCERMPTLDGKGPGYRGLLATPGVVWCLPESWQAWDRQAPLPFPGRASFHLEAIAQ